MPQIIDSHAHLYFDSFDSDRSETIARARAAGVVGVINIGIDVATSRQAIDLAREHGGFHAAVGIHPTTAVDDLDTELRRIIELTHERGVVAIGEIGLDDHWKEVPLADQYPKLEAQLDMALDRGLPIVVHCRDALDELLELLERRRTVPRGVFHCFGGGAPQAERALALGFHISFAGNVTYPKAEDLRAALAVVPVERLLLETDAPFLAPQARRGKRNEPAFVVHTCEFIAREKAIETDELAEIARETTETLFGLPGEPKSTR